MKTWLGIWAFFLLVSVSSAKADPIDDYANEARQLYSIHGPNQAWITNKDDVNPPPLSHPVLNNLFTRFSPIGSLPEAPVCRSGNYIVPAWKGFLKDAKSRPEALEIIYRLIHLDWLAVNSYRLERLEFLESRVDGEKRYMDLRFHGSFDEWMAELKRLREGEAEYQKALAVWENTSRAFWYGGWQTYVKKLPDHTALPNCVRDSVAVALKGKIPPWGWEEEKATAIKTACSAEVTTAQRQLREEVRAHAYRQQTVADAVNLANATSAYVAEMRKRALAPTDLGCKEKADPAEAAFCVLEALEHSAQWINQRGVIQLRKQQLKHAIVTLESPLFPKTEALRTELAEWYQVLNSIQKSLSQVAEKAKALGGAQSGPDFLSSIGVQTDFYQREADLELQKQVNNVIQATQGIAPTPAAVGPTTFSAVTKARGEPLYIDVFAPPRPGGQSGRGGKGGESGSGSGGGSGSPGGILHTGPGGISVSVPGGGGGGATSQGWKDYIVSRSATYDALRGEMAKEIPVLTAKVGADFTAENARVGGEIEKKGADTTKFQQDAQRAIADGLADPLRRIEPLVPRDGLPLPEVLKGVAYPTDPIKQGAWRTAVGSELAAQIAEGAGDSYAMGFYREVAKVMGSVAAGIVEQKRLLIGLTPGIGFCQDVYEAITGRDIDGNILSSLDRSLAIAGILTAGVASKTKIGSAALESLGKIFSKGANRKELAEGIKAAEGILKDKEIFASGKKGLQKIYDIVGTHSADEVNALLKESHGYKAPFMPGTTVRRLVTKEEQAFVRVHGSNNQARGWVVKPESLQGMTPQQIKTKLNLPEVPTFISDVKVPSGTELLRGKAGPVEGLGSASGAVQYFIDGKIPENFFSNMRPIK